MKAIRISEIFGPTIQGEGPLIGRPTIFVRTAGCDYRCTWCDTLYAVLPEHHDDWLMMSPEEILTRVKALAGSKPVLVSLSGGNPALQPLEPLISQGRREGHTFLLETQASVAQSWFALLDWLILSPKAPSSGMTTDWDTFNACLEATLHQPRCAIKVTIFDDSDYAYARAVGSRYPTIPIYLQVGNPTPVHKMPFSDATDTNDLIGRFRWLVERVAHDRWFEATVLPQLHVLAWGNRRAV